MIMKQNRKVYLNKYLVIFIFISLASCVEDKDYSISIKNESVGVFKDFEIKKKNKDYYEIKFDNSDLHKGILEFEKDTVFLKLNSPLYESRNPLFIRNNYEEIKDTIFLKGDLKDNKVLIIREESIKYEDISNTKIIFLKTNSENLGYRISFSFNKGFLQILTKNNVSVEVLNFLPSLEYKFIPLNRGVYEI